MAFADAFANEEPAQHFNCNQSIQPSLTNWGLLPCTGFGTFNQCTKSYMIQKISPIEFQFRFNYFVLAHLDEWPECH